MGNKMDRVLLSVKRFKQQPSECAIAAASSLANFFDSSVAYKEVRELVPKKIRKEGLETSQEARLLNQLGFEAVTIVTADLNLVDFGWANYTKKSIIRRMKMLRAHYRRQKEKDLVAYVNDMVDWLEDDRYDNNIVIDYEFKKHIKRQLARGVPVGAAINWTSLFKFSKGDRRQNGDISGEPEDHAIVLRGCDDKGVFVVDSHHECYKGKRAKYKSGYYKLPWDKFLVNVPSGDLILL
jgi:hypothetical protein